MHDDEGELRNGMVNNTGHPLMLLLNTTVALSS